MIFSRGSLFRELDFANNWRIARKIQGMAFRREAHQPPCFYRKRFMSTLAPSFETLLEASHRISKDVSALHANDVDVKGRFPREAVEAMRTAKLGCVLWTTNSGVRAVAMRCAASRARERVAGAMASRVAVKGCQPNAGGVVSARATV